MTEDLSINREKTLARLIHDKLDRTGKEVILSSTPSQKGKDVALDNSTFLVLVMMGMGTTQNCELDFPKAVNMKEDDAKEFVPVST